jgi:ABC-type glycerol-3-phosphate transport system substrate-binding protein
MRGSSGGRRDGPAAVLAAVLASLLVAVLAVAGCGGSARPVGDGTLLGQTVEVAAIWTGAEQAAFRAVLDAFEQRTGATVRYTSGGNDLPALLNSRLAGGSPPDVAMLGQPGVVTELARRGALHPLTGPAAAAVAAHFPPAWQELGVIDGTLYGAYYKVAHKSIIWYRTDAFGEAGVRPPATWEDFLTVTSTLADAGVGPMALPAADGWVLTDWFENIYLRVAGPERYDQLVRREIPWTDPTVVRALGLLRDYWTLDRGIQGGPDGATQLTFVQAVADVFGARPKSAMIFEGDFVATEIGKLGTVAVGRGAEFFEWPSIDGSPPAVITAGDQAVALRDTPGAMRLIAFLASPEAAEIAAARGGYLSANQDLDLAHYPDHTTRQLATSLLRAELLRFDLSDLTPQAFGGGSQASMLRLLQDFVAHPDPVRTAAALEAAARHDFRTAR